MKFTGRYTAATAKALMAAFKTVAAVRSAPPEELEKVPGVGPRTARDIWEFYHSEPDKA